MMLPPKYQGLAAAFGEGDLADKHFISKCLSDAHGALVLDWLDARYGVVFSSPNVLWQGDRRTELSRRLRNQKEFDPEDAVLQAMATMLSDPRARIVAQSEGGVRGERRADLLMSAPSEADVEVCLLRDFDIERQTDRVRADIDARLGRALGKNRTVTIITRVNRARDERGGVVLHDGMAKALVRRAVEVANASPSLSEPTLVALSSSGDPFVYDGTQTLHGALAEVELRPSAVGLRMTYTGLRPVEGEEEARRTLRRKIRRKQRLGTRPFVLVLNQTGAPLFGEAEVRTGIQSVFDESTSVSAVVVQCCRVSTPGIGISPDTTWAVSFSTEVLVNARAKFPVPEELRQVLGAMGPPASPRQGR